MTEQMTASEDPNLEFVLRTPLYSELLGRGYMFDFFQVVWLLEHLFPGASPSGESSAYDEERIRFRPHTGLVFPAADVRAVEIVREPVLHARVTATFLGLYGVDSPLPVYFYNEIATEEERIQPLRDFLDIFNHRIYSLFYRALKKYHPMTQYKPGGMEPSSHRTICLAGLGTRKALETCPMPPMRLAAFAGFLSCRVRHAEGLRKLLEGVVDGLRVRVVQNVRRWVAVSCRPRLGGGPRASAILGMTTTIGERVLDASGKFRLILGPLTLARFLRFLPGGEDAPLLRWLVSLYAPDCLAFDVELQLQAVEVPPVRLGDAGVRLGLNSWCGRPREAIASRVIEYV